MKRINPPRKTQNRALPTNNHSITLWDITKILHIKFTSVYTYFDLLWIYMSIQLIHGRAKQHCVSEGLTESAFSSWLWDLFTNSSIIVTTCKCEKSMGESNTVFPNISQLQQTPVLKNSNQQQATNTHTERLTTTSLTCQHFLSMGGNTGRGTIISTLRDYLKRILEWMALT